MCGIIGICKHQGGKEKIGAIIRRALEKLEYRGYDSVGFAIVDRDGRVIVRKSKGKIADLYNKLRFDIYDGNIGFGHTRWATHGAPNDTNAHPHFDCSKCIVIVHNGIIQNYQELRDYIKKDRDHTIRSDTDTEIIAHLLEHYIDRGESTLNALRKATKIIKGTYAFLIINCREPDRIYFARNISPLIIGIGKESIAIASDLPAIVDLCDHYISIDDQELGYISLNEIYIEKFSGESINYRERLRKIEIDPLEISKGGFPHYMLKEIYEQPLAVKSSLDGIKDQIHDIIPLLAKADNIYIVGAGTSYHAALVLEYGFSNYAKINARSIVSSEYKKYLDIIGDRDVVIAISQSGETIDTILATRSMRDMGAKTIGLTNVISSTLDRESDYSIYTRAGPEIGVAATKTFTSQVAVGMYIVAETSRYSLGRPDPRIEDIYIELNRLPNYIANILDTIAGEVRTQTTFLKDTKSMYFLGRGSSLPVSMEGALKIKEISYIHAEAYPAGESKHGPIALVERGFPVFFTVFDDEYKEIILGNIEEMKARGAYITLVAPERYSSGFKLADKGYKMPTMKTVVASAAYVIVYQLLSYYLAISRGYDPDKPRNLAKTVTVE